MDRQPVADLDHANGAEGDLVFSAECHPFGNVNWDGDAFFKCIAVSCDLLKDDTNMACIQRQSLERFSTHWIGRNAPEM